MGQFQRAAERIELGGGAGAGKMRAAGRAVAGASGGARAAVAFPEEVEVPKAGERREAGGGSASGETRP